MRQDNDERAAGEKRDAGLPSIEELRKRLAHGAECFRATSRITSKMLRITEKDLKLRLRS
jgi:hypothetical protein